MQSERPPLNYLFSGFAGKDRADLERFHANVDRLQRWSVGQADVTISLRPQLGAQVAGGGGWEISAALPDEEAVYGSLALFRQTYTPHLRASAVRVIKILIAHANERGTPAARAIISQLREQGRRLKRLRQKDAYGSLLVEENPFSDEHLVKPEAILDLFFNGDVFHDEPEKERELDSGTNTRALYRLSLHTAMKSHISAWAHLDSLVGAVLRHPALDRRG